MISIEALASALLLILALGGVLFFVGRPIAAGRTNPPPARVDGELAVARARALDALIELERDRSLGVISDADFAALREAYERQALDVYRQIEAAGDDSMAAGVPERQQPDDAGSNRTAQRRGILIAGMLLGTLVVALGGAAWNLSRGPWREGPPRAAASTTISAEAQSDAALPAAGGPLAGLADGSEKIVVERQAVLIMRPDPVARSFEVLELVVLRNDADHAWMPRVDGPAGPMGLLRFSLPDGAAQLRAGGALAGEALFTTDRGIASQRVVPPGRTEITFAYRVQYGADTYRLAKTFPYPTERVEMQVPSDIAGGADRLTDEGTVAAGDRLYTRYGARDLPPRTVIELRLRALPGAPPAVLDPLVRLGAIVLAGCAVIAATMLALWRGHPTASARSRRSAAT